jgi:hypothetical protein
MTKFFSTFIFLVIVSATISAQVGINTASPNASAALDVTSTDKGLLIPRVASTGDIASPTAGMMVYQTGGTAGFYFYNSSWNLVGGGDNLGDHTATQNLNMANNDLLGVDSLVANTMRIGRSIYNVKTVSTLTAVTNIVASSWPSDILDYSIIRVPGTASGATLHGFPAGKEGQVIHILLNTGQNLIVASASVTEPTATNRIFLQVQGGNITTTGSAGFTMIYVNNFWYFLHDRL